MKYFMHDTNAFNDDKISELFLRYGYEGVGLFYCILEKLAAQEKPIKTSILKKQLFVGKKLDKIWVFFEEIELIFSQNGDTFNKKMLSNTESFSIVREKTKERVSNYRDKIRDNQDDTKNVTRNDSITTRISNASNKINKENKRRGKVVSFDPSGQFAVFEDGSQKELTHSEKTRVKYNDLTIEELNSKICTGINS